MIGPSIIPNLWLELELSGPIRPMMGHPKNAIWQLVGLAGEMIKTAVGRDAGAAPCLPGEEHRKWEAELWFR